MLWREAFSISDPIVEIVVYFLDRFTKIFFGPDAALHNTFHEDIEEVRRQ